MIVALGLNIAGLAEATALRGLRLVPVTQPRADAAVLLGWQPGEMDCAALVAGARHSGWHGPLMLALGDGRADQLAAALDAGADDAVILPGCPHEIAARLAARLRPRILQIGDLSIDTVARAARRGGQPLGLLPREYAVLLYLARANGRFVSREELLARVWGLRFDPGTNVVEVHVSRLRARLDRGQPHPLLHNEKKRGYRLVTSA